MTYRLQIDAKAARALKAIQPASTRKMISQAVLELAWNPFGEVDITELRGHGDYYRLKIPPYRVLYRVGKAVVYVFRIEKRSGKTYRGFNPEGDAW